MPLKFTWLTQFLALLVVFAGQAHAQQPPAQAAQGNVVALNDYRLKGGRLLARLKVAAAS